MRPADVLLSLAGSLASRGRDGETDVRRAVNECVIKGGDSGVVPLGGVEHAAVGHLEASRRPQLTQAVGGAARKFQTLDCQLCQESVEAVCLAGPGRSNVDLSKRDDTGSERVSQMRRQQCRRVSMMQVGRLEVPDEDARVQND